MVVVFVLAHLVARIVSIQTGSDCAICELETRSTVCMPLVKALAVREGLAVKDAQSNFSHWDYEIQLCGVEPRKRKPEV
jgi:hypothetical protein